MLVSKLMTDDESDNVDDDGDESAPIATTAATTTAFCSRSMIVLTDGDMEAMRLLQQNLVDPYNEIDSNRVKATYLRWNEQLDAFDDWCRRSSICCTTTTPTAAAAATSVTSIAGSHPSDDMGDSAATKNVEFDTILAGDVMYKPELPMLFFKTVQRYLRQGGVLWLCHVPRSTVTHQVVMDAAVSMGFSMVPALTGESLVFENHSITKDDLLLRTEQGFTIQDCPREDLDRAVVYQITRSD